ncbi:MAG: methyltransferase [Dehalococcoidia bacterium]
MTVEHRVTADLPAAAALFRGWWDGFRLSQATCVATKLGIPDLLADGPRASADLAQVTGTHPVALFRLLRGLTAAGLLVMDEELRFALTPLGASLQRGLPGELRAHILFQHDRVYQVFGDLLYSVQTGKPAFDHLYGQSNWEWYATDAEASAIHDESMASETNVMTAALLAAYDFSPFGTIVDVGGGSGALLAAVLEATPTARGVLFDLPFVVAEPHPALRAPHLTERTTLVGGSFFDAVPSGGDAYVLKFVVHDWDDAHSAAILRACHTAMAGTGTLLVMDVVLPERVEASPTAQFGTLMDLTMLVWTPNGRERTAAEFQTLLTNAGFVLKRIVPAMGPLCIIEAMPA